MARQPSVLNTECFRGTVLSPAANSRLELLSDQGVADRPATLSVFSSAATAMFATVAIPRSLADLFKFLAMYHRKSMEEDAKPIVKDTGVPARSINVEAKG
jgi:hypothetical protein